MDDIFIKWALTHPDDYTEQENRDIAEAAAGRIEQLTEALKVYADTNHLSDELVLDWESCSGGPGNVLWSPPMPEDNCWYVEDGSVARDALRQSTTNDKGQDYETAGAGHDVRPQGVSVPRK